MTRGVVAALVLVAVALPQTEAMNLARRAFDLARQGRVDEAIAQLREAVRLEPANPLFQSAMGGIFERQGKLAEAVAAFGAAARLAPTNDAMRQRLEAVSLEWGAELARAQRNRAGLVLARHTVKRFPRSPRAHLMLGLFETRNQQNLAAVAAYRRALELDPHAAEASVGLGIAQSAAGMPSEAQATFEEGIKRFPTDATHRQALGVLLVKLAESGAVPQSRATEMLESALKLDPKLSETHYQLGNLALASGDTAGAIRHFEAASRNGLDDSRLRHAKARALRHAGGALMVGAKPEPAATPGGFAFRSMPGFAWRHFNGQSPDRFLVESTTGGVAFLDFDNDGLLDMLFVNGGETPRGRSSAPVRHALYRNLGKAGFTDVIARSGIGPRTFYGMGVAAADFDNDGHTDIYITGYPRGALYRNNGNGTFADVTERSGAANQGEWGTSAAWFDYDNDGLLDLFIANYAEFSFADKRRCEFDGKPAYCAQTEYVGRPSRLYRNNGDGTFADRSIASGVAALPGRALGVVAVDSDGDGRQDLFVARDASPNLLLHNRGDGTFNDTALEAEVAFNADGIARAGMGVDAGDVDGDGRPDFVVTNFDTEYHALYLNPGRLPFLEATVASGLARHSRPYVGWGVRMVDFDNNGHLDLFIVNGHLHEAIAQSNRTVSYREPPLLLSNDGRARFTRIDAPALRGGYLGRGMASGDFDNDGAVDVAFVSLNDPPVVLRNEGSGGGRWLGVRLRGTVSNRDSIGAKLSLRVGDRTLTRWITGGGSFLASHDRRVVFGLGAHGAVGELEIRWPSGRVQRVGGLVAGRYQEVVEQ